MKNLIYKFLFTGSIAALIAGCSATAKYQQPQIELPAAYNYAAGTDSVSIADIEWKAFFTDTALQALITKALDNNNDWHIALKNIERADRLLQQARAGNLPEVNLQATAQTTALSDNSLNGLSTKLFLGRQHIEDYTIAAQASWEADIWGKIRGRKEQALAEYMATFEGTKAVKAKLITDVADGYYNLLMLDEQLKIARRNVTLGDSTLYLIRLQFEAGEATSLAIQQAEAQRAVAALLEPQLQQAIALQENALQLLAGALPGRVSRASIKVVLPQQLPAGLPAALLSQRPDVKASELQLKAAYAAEGVAKASLYPSLRITASGGLNTFTASNWFNIPASLFGIAAGSISQPIFQRKQLKTQVAVAGIAREQAVYRFRQSVIAAVGEVTDALVKIDRLKAQEQVAAGRKNTLTKAVEQSSLLFNSGMATYLEVITAQANALQSELELANINRLQAGAVISLYKAVGGGTK
jgi:outer membrane protein, multidrug efflux system